MLSKSLDCRSNAAQIQLERPDFRMQECPECTSNAIRYFVLKEPNKNAVGIFRLPLECGSNTVGTSRLKCRNASRIAAGIYPDIFGTKRTQLECTSNAVRILRLPLECGSNAYGTSQLGCKNVPKASRLPLESLDCHSNAVGTSRLRFKNAPNAPRMHIDCRRNLFRYFRY